MSDAYDPGAPEGETSAGAQYLNKRDVRTIAAILVVVGLCMIPIYKNLEKSGQKAVCKTNLQAIASAINQYAEQNDGRFPPAHATDASGTAPLVDAKGNRLITWATEISTYMKVRASFNCPAAAPEESVLIYSQRPIDNNNVSDRSRKLGEELSSYGMYSAYSGYPVQQVADPNQTLLITETANMGSRDTFDPLPFKDGDGKVIPYDGFAIGWDNSNEIPNSKTKSVSRLAFYGSQKGDFLKDSESRHGDFIHALTATGSLINIDPASALVQQRASIVGHWAVPATLGRK
ncbi:hypothetical protein BH11ARM1_BH11ARM1_00360 [soil metagenome]